MAEASWSAVYDIRADMSGDNNPLTLVYKAAIKQSTGEVALITVSSYSKR